MERYRPHRRPKEELQRFLFQRLLTHLCHIRPDVPMPLIFLDDVLGVDLYVEDPPEPILEEKTEGGQTWIDLTLVHPPPISFEPDELFDITGPDFERATITVSELQRARIQQLIEEIQQSGKWVQHHVFDDSVMIMLIQMYHFILNDGPEQALDHLALLASHGLYWLEVSLSRGDTDGTFSALQVSAALWMLVRYEVIALAELVPLLPPVLERMDTPELEWSDWSSVPLGIVAEWGATMAEVGEPELQPWVERLFAVCQRLLKRTRGGEQLRADALLFKARLRAGL